MMLKTNRISNKLIIATAVVFMSQSAFSDNADRFTNNRGNNNTTTANNSDRPGNTNTNSNVVSSSSAGPTINQGANTSKSSNSSTATLSKIIGAANMGMGAVKMYEFAGSCSGAGVTCNYGFLFQGILHFAMGAMSFKQASNNAGAGYDAGVTGIDTSSWTNPFGDPNNPNGGGGNTGKDKDKDLTTHVNTGKLDEIKNKLTTTGIGGVRLDPKTGKIFDSNTGKSYDVNSLGNAKGMADAGFSDSDIAAALAASSAAEKAAMKKLGLDSPQGIGAATAENGFGDGGSAATVATVDAPVDSSGSGRRGLASAGLGGPVASGQIAGLTKNFNGERIGVPAENIFNMMARRYKTKEKQNTFFDPSETVKMPQ